MPNNKYNQLKRQYSIDGGITWHDLLPMVYKVGNVIETNSDCTDSDGCRWVILPITEAYDCDSNYNMYQVEAEECLNENGVFVRSGNIRRYQLIENYSLVCGYSGPICTPTSITSYSYDIVYNGGAVEWDEVATPVVYKITTISEIDKGCNETTTSNREEITDYTISYSPSGNNTTGEDRLVTATVIYKDENIGSFDYVQKQFYSKPIDIEDKVLYNSNVESKLYDECIVLTNKSNLPAFYKLYSSLYKDKYIVSSYFVINTENGEINYLSTPNDTYHYRKEITELINTNYNTSDVFTNQLIVDTDNIDDNALYYFDENDMNFKKLYEDDTITIYNGIMGGGYYDDYAYIWDFETDEPIKYINSNLEMSDFEKECDTSNEYCYPKQEMKNIGSYRCMKTIEIKEMRFSCLFICFYNR